MPGFGTRDYADVTVNYCTGDCPNACRYCYSRLSRRLRHGDVQLKDVRKMAFPRDKIVMFPSTCDLFPQYFGTIQAVLLKLLERGNKVIVVSKFSVPVMDALLAAFPSSQASLKFRGTVNSTYWETFWEPHAPAVFERTHRIETSKRAGVPREYFGETLPRRTPCHHDLPRRVGVRRRGRVVRRDEPRAAIVGQRQLPLVPPASPDVCPDSRVQGTARGEPARALEDRETPTATG